MVKPRGGPCGDRLQPFSWREGEYLADDGAGLRGAGGMVLLYGSKDLAHWDYLHPLFTAPPFERRFDVIGKNPMKFERGICGGM